MTETSARDTMSRLGSVAPPAPGDPGRIGPYAVLGRLGSGGMGTVYLARRAGAPAEPLVAVKVVHPDLADEAAFRARFRHEVAAARRVTPFCTARVLDADADADPPYLVTEYVDGIPLGRVVAEGGPLAESTLHGVAIGVAAALAAIHSAGLVHRDLKPANVLLSLSGPRVIDFGIARALDSAYRLTMAGVVLGTPGWMAPEQFRGGAVGPAADVFSWGSLVGYAGTGRQPWGDEGPPASFAYRIMHAEPDLAGLDVRLSPLVEAALRKDPGRRPSARDLVLALVGGSPAAAAPLTGAGAVGANPTAAATVAATRLLRSEWAPPNGWAGTAVRPPPGPPATRRLPTGPSVRAPWPPPTPPAIAPGGSRPAVPTRRPPAPAAFGPPYGYQPAPPTRRRRWYRKKRYLMPLGLLTLLALASSSPEVRNGPSLRGAGRSPAGGAPSGQPSTAQPSPRTPSSQTPSSQTPSSQTPGPQQAPGVGIPVRDGQLQFTIRSWRCGVASVGTAPWVRTAQGQYCLADVEVSNIGAEARTLFEGYEKALAGPAEYPADLGARLYLGRQTLWNRIDPGATARGTMAFDVPRDVRPDELELHDSWLSGGVTVPL